MSPDVARAAGGTGEASAGAGSLRPQDLVLDLLGTYVRPRKTVWAGGLVALLGDFGFSNGAARIALARLVNGGLLGRLRDGRLVHYTVPRRTERILAEGDRRIFRLGREPWDGTWTFLLTSLPDGMRAERHRLGRRLRFLGFGAVQDGVWVAARDREADVVELVDALSVREFATVFVGQPASSLSVAAIVDHAWDLEAVERQYRAFLDEFGSYTAAGPRASLSDRDAFVLRTRLIDAFRQFPAVDPELPGTLTGRSIPRDEAVAAFQAIDEALAEPSQRYFDERTDSRRRTA